MRDTVEPRAPPFTPAVNTKSPDWRRQRGSLDTICHTKPGPRSAGRTNFNSSPMRTVTVVCLSAGVSVITVGGELFRPITVEGQPQPVRAAAAAPAARQERKTRTFIAHRLG